MMRALIAVVFLLSTVPASAGKLDLDDSRYEPLPSIAAADSAIFPGAGWIYISHRGGDAEDFAVGLAFMVGTVGGIMLSAKLFQDKNPMLGAGAALGVVGLRFGDVHGASRRAVTLNLNRRRVEEK